MFRAPIYEEDVVNLIMELAKVTDKLVSRKELFRAEDEKESAWGVGKIECRDKAALDDFERDFAPRGRKTKPRGHCARAA